MRSQILNDPELEGEFIKLDKEFNKIDFSRFCLSDRTTYSRYFCIGDQTVSLKMHIYEDSSISYEEDTSPGIAYRKNISSLQKFFARIKELESEEKSSRTKLIVAVRSCVAELKLYLGNKTGEK
jgi:hypothetical protein